jgi:glycosyltransferase involved in cell wall biosynthesis
MNNMHPIGSSTIIDNGPTVMHVVTSLHFGGVEKHMELISEELLAASMNHVFVALGGGGETAERLRENRAEVVCLNQPVRIPSFGALTRLFKLLKKYRPVVIHTHGAEANFHGLIAGWLADIPVRIAEEIGMPEHGAKAKLTFRLVYGLAHRVIGVSEIVSAWLENNNEVPRSKLVCLNCPTRLPRQRMTRDPELDAQFRVCFVGRLEPVKNPLVLIPAAVKLIEQGIPLEVWIIGEGSLRPELERQIEKNGLTGIVKLHGFQADPAEFMRRSSIYVQPSFSEGFGISLVEAMGCGVPVVVPRIGSAPELVETNVSGWLLEDNSTEAVVEGLRQAWDAGPQRLFEMGQAAHKTVEGRFEPARYVRDLEALYSRVSAGNKERVRCES